MQKIIRAVINTPASEIAAILAKFLGFLFLEDRVKLIGY
jgi:hypothetical protein